MEQNNSSSFSFISNYIISLLSSGKKGAYLRKLPLYVVSESKPRAITCKFLYRPERYKVIRKKRDLKDGVWRTEDLIWEDREKKKKLKDVMKEAFESGKKPIFHRGKLYVDGTLYRDT